jgi:hypothetical protein
VASLKNPQPTKITSIIRATFEFLPPFFSAATQFVLVVKAVANGA